MNKELRQVLKVIGESKGMDFEFDSGTNRLAFKRYNVDSDTYNFWIFDAYAVEIVYYDLGEDYVEEFIEYLMCPYSSDIIVDQLEEAYRFMAIKVSEKAIKLNLAREGK